MSSKTHQEASQNQHPEKGAKNVRFQTTLGGLMGSIWDQFLRPFATLLACVFDIIFNDVKYHKKHPNRPQKHLFLISFFEIFARWAHMRFWTTLHQKSSIFQIRGIPKATQKRATERASRKRLNMDEKCFPKWPFGTPLGTIFHLKSDAEKRRENDTNKTLKL